MNLDRWHQANNLYRAGMGEPQKIHPRGSMACVGRCGATIAGNARPPLCRACKLLFDAQVLVDQARAEAERAAQELRVDAAAGSQAQAEEGPTHPQGVHEVCGVEGKGYCLPVPTISEIAKRLLGRDITRKAL